MKNLFFLILLFLDILSCRICGNRPYGFAIRLVILVLQPLKWDMLFENKY